MSDRLDRALRAFLRRSTLDRPATERISARLRPLLRDDPDLRDRALQATTAHPRALVRVHDRLRERRRPGWRVGATAIFALAALAATAAAGVWVVHDRPAPVDLVLAGEGQVGGTREAPEIAWTSGRLDVRVTPHLGVHLGVTTPEARVEVVGTRFSVEREDHATVVQVVEGRVRVVCAGEPERFLAPGEQHRCLPSDPAALLSRAVDLDRDGATAEERLETATHGLGADAPSATLAELRAHELQALADLGRTDEALRAAAAYLETGEGARRAEVSGFVARTRFEREGCGARDALETAVAADPSGPEALLLATCLADRQPGRAEALVRTAAPGATGAYRDLADQLVKRLGIRW